MRRTLEVLNDLEKLGSSAASLDDFVSCYLGCSRRPADDEERLSHGGYIGSRFDRKESELKDDWSARGKGSGKCYKSLEFQDSNVATA